jgi:hypothetical protein
VHPRQEEAAAAAEVNPNFNLQDHTKLLPVMQNLRTLGC